MAMSTFKTYLMKGTTSTSTTTWSKLVDIKSYPDLGSEKEEVETTTLSDPKRRYAPGIENTEKKVFTANYDPGDFATLLALDGIEGDYAVWYGAEKDSNGEWIPNGEDGKITYKGYIHVLPNGGGVGETRDMTIELIVSDGPDYDVSST